MTDHENMTMLEAFKRDAPGYVAAGAEWLDRHEPGWERRIDLAELCLMDSCSCILGQVSPEKSYVQAVARITEDPDRYEHHSSWSVQCGFNIPVAVGAEGLRVAVFFEVLDQLWIALIKERFDSGILSG